MSPFWIVLLSATAGTVVSSVLACLPGLHIYNVMGAMVLGILALEGSAHAISPDVYLPAFTAMIVGWSMLNTIPAVLLGTPDESAMFTVLPGQKYLMAGRGFTAPNRNFTAGDEVTGLIRVIPETLQEPPRKALCNAAGFGGTNSCLALDFTAGRRA